jgi:AraC family transcriptional regulator of adaptative response/methylated-DNA-[protein]-cysteine methyltransferase
LRSGESSLGAILVASSRKGVASILIGDDPNELVQNLRDRFPEARLIAALLVVAIVIVARY